MKIKRILVRFIINHFFCCTRMFELKRCLLNWSGIYVGTNTKVVGPIHYDNVSTISIGNDCWIGKDLYLDGNGCITIGDNCDIAPHVVIATGGHEIGNYSRRAGKNIVNNITIENGCWIGTRSLILNSTIIHKGSVIAAGAVVCSDVESNFLVTGVPAKNKKELKK